MSRSRPDHILDPNGDVIIELRIEPGNGATKPHEESFQVCSRHLILASGYFRMKFAGPWKRAYQSRGSQCLRVPQDCNNLGMFLVLMNIFHGHSRGVPRKVSLGELVSFAALVETYECLDIVGFFADIWIRALKGRLPRTFSDTAKMWTYVAYIFQEPIVFQSMTKIAVKHGKRITSSDLLLPPDVCLEIEKQRVALNCQLLIFLKRTVLRLQVETSSNNSGSAGLTLGILSARLADLRLLNRRPTRPFYHERITTYLEALEHGVKGLRLCDART
ncbi:hypothetical protein McanCB49686_002641 [Microsporum canis]